MLASQIEPQCAPASDRPNMAAGEVIISRPALRLRWAKLKNGAYELAAAPGEQRVIDEVDRLQPRRSRPGPQGATGVEGVIDGIVQHIHVIETPQERQPRERPSPLVRSA
jgi:hypothetical protein